MNQNTSISHLRDSISTLDSERSNTTASSIFSVGRSNSRASTNTAISEHSLLSSTSYSSLDLSTTSQSSRNAAHGRSTTQAQYGGRSEHVLDDPRRAALLRTATQQAALRGPLLLASEVADSAARHTTPLLEKQASNKFACSHCSEVFTKKSDRKKHWNQRCQHLGDPNTPRASPGDGFVCPLCGFVARNEFQRRKHQQMSGHQGSWDPIHLSSKERFTCSNHGIIYHSAHDFYAHFDRDACPLNRHSGGKDGYRHHQTRIITLLQEGRDGRHGNHTYLYAALSAYCITHGLHKDDWHSIVHRHSAEDALALANKLEWGFQRSDRSPANRLGFTNVHHMLAQVVPVRDLTGSNPNMNSLSLHVPSSYQRGASTPAAEVDGQSPWPELSGSRFVERMERNIAQTAMLQPTCLPRQQAELRIRQQDNGFAVHRTQPLSYVGIEVPDSNFHGLASTQYDPVSRDQWEDSEASWLLDAEQNPAMSLQGQGGEFCTRKEMEVVDNAPSLFLSQATSLGASGSFNAYEPTDWLPTAIYEYPERAALTPSPAIANLASQPDMLQPANKKRPISNNSAVLADSVARSRLGPGITLAHRPMHKDPSVDMRNMAHPGSPRSSQRSSGDSVVGKWFNYPQYYDQPPTPTLLLPGTKAASFDEIATNEAKASNERSRTTGQAMKAMLRKIATPTPCEMDGDSTAQLVAIPCNSTRSRSGSMRCIHCGVIDNIECLTKHIGQQVGPRHNRRQASILDPTEVERAFHDFRHEDWL
ncbi:Putative Zinc finger C2H2-type, Rubredoxin-like domain-containing protein [Septoria linicola]|uniref:Zinc finger C2H2-type, Rubredoxin-like domain-containing protein n=1 Tax=Septoria linicola TaxID=215465 RepID=A0A9Q9EID8_9PEZI|nr:putative Zinc finger C2H2-type, Rubredoxin-like domain-containing protein [Septoria linicola]USW50927.1 Putative Zinc finger C2H2-type, Rubredoxin-like domain-containing protein [Septoria linicola]